ncbi:3-phosphoshikimate 1-carboxyvinyltransferase [Candidatus Protochlamydia amoebophila]|nr:3-phosphoshikimate 1-carboxyvinyltransferase [Candidatus Protochlamydia amoebophila]
MILIALNLMAHKPSFHSCQLCVSLIGLTCDAFIHQIQQLSSQVDLIEIRLDKLLKIDFSELNLLKEIAHCPLIWTLRKKSQGGNFLGNIQKQFLIFKELARRQPDFVDIEADIPLEWLQELQNISPQTQWIISWHEVKETPHLKTCLDQLYALPGNYYKLACYTHSVIDSLKLLEMAQQENKHSRRLCTIGLGMKGQCTRILAPVTGQPFTFASLKEGLESAPGQISFQTLFQTYRFKNLSQQTEIFGLIGHPIDKSLSHLTHNAVLDHLNQNAVYIKFDVEEAELELFFQHIQHFSVRGFSVTMPHKERVKKILALNMDDEGHLACNTLLFSSSIISGTNTDGIGALKALKIEDLKDKKVILLGAGGTSQAIAYEAKKRGAEVTILNRTVLRAKDVAEKIQVKWGDFEQLKDAKKNECDILIQTTSVGMSPHVDALVVSADWIPQQITVLDVISHPFETLFLQKARLKGCKICHGIELFIHQAVFQFGFWFNKQFDQKLIEQTIREALPMPFNQKKIAVQKSALAGDISLPPSKSHSIRAILLGAMTQGISRVKNLLDSPDVEHAKLAAIALGAKIEQVQDEYLISGVAGQPKTPSGVIDAGNSGQVLRFAGAFAALNHGYTVITGDHSICSRRPAQPLLDGLRCLGAFAKSTRENGYAPLIIKGPIYEGTAELEGQDSQPVSALLMASAFIHGTTEIFVKYPGEKPWIDLTLHWLNRLGVSYINQNYEYFKIEGIQQRPHFEVNIPGDLSAAAFPVAAAILTQSKITLYNVDMSDVQGDKQVIHVLQEMGADIQIDQASHTLTVLPGALLKGTTIDVNPFIDAVPILAVLACFAKGETHLINAAIARQKESNRLRCIAIELKKMGAQIMETDDGLLIRNSTLKGASVESYDDHRLAMALIVAGLASEGITEVKGIDCIKKSFPNFIQDLKKLGARFS